MGQVDTSLFTPELVFFDVDASTSDELFETLEPELKAKGYVKDSWLDAIKAREHSYPTGLECQAISVGIPHVEPEHIVKPYIAVIRNTRPIAFAPMGGMDFPEPSPPGGGPILIFPERILSNTGSRNT